MIKNKILNILPSSFLPKHEEKKVVLHRKYTPEEIEQAIAKNFNYIKAVFGPEMEATSFEEIKEKFLKGDMKSIEELNALMGFNSQMIIETIEKGTNKTLSKKQLEKLEPTLSKTKNLNSSNSIDVPTALEFIKDFREKIRDSFSEMEPVKNGFRSPSTKIKKRKKKNGRR